MTQYDASCAVMTVPKSRKRERGIAAVELALLLPMLVILALCTIDGARALQANIIMTNVAREGANLASRGGTDLEDGSQDIIYAVMASAPPLNVNQQGMMYITRVMGVGTTRSVVLDQYRWDDAARNLGARKSSYQPASRIYACGSWNSAGKCTGISSSSRPTVSVLTGKLDNGEIVYVVETFYKFDMLVNAFTFRKDALPTFGPDLYSMSVF
ncbi:TadE/TadG family type IV pilus assembly protein [Massilia sp. HP4]|uniref:TadE/TadG family type IV pilus assembly protein n=1 Tax=Massilia sp. HP4 TaxID=2562316 RepID=UPI0010C077C0|nr:TadE/TadG family type IV pilus assembly protein [Massilia sp. HP4]